MQTSMSIKYMEHRRKTIVELIDSFIDWCEKYILPFASKWLKDYPAMKLFDMFMWNAVNMRRRNEHKKKSGSFEFFVY